MKKFPFLISTVLLLSAPLTALANGSNEDIGSENLTTFSSPPSELVSTPDFGTTELAPIGESKLLYSGPSGGELLLEKPLHRIDDGGFSTKVVINDSANFVWKFDETINGSDKLVKNGYSWLGTILLAGSGGLSAYWVTSLFTTSSAKAVSGAMALSVWNRGTKNLNASSYTYWTVQKYVDKDSYNLYDRYVVKVYTDKAKTKLKESFTEVHSNRYR